MIINTDLIYPIGSIYISVNSTNPSKFFGGTWVSFAEGKTLVGLGTNTDGSGNTMSFNEVEYVFGEYKHKLTVQEMPSHQHGNNSSVPNTYGYAVMTTEGSNLQTGVGGAKIKEMYNTGKNGGDQSHNTCQPSIIVYMWKRTA